MIKAYASYFVSYLLSQLRDFNDLNSIILFGSAARDETKKESDIDIFVDINKKSKRLEDQINKIVDGFYKSREALIFKNKGIDNKINLIIDKFENIGDLKNSIESNGIMLYGNYVSSNVRGKKHLIVIWDKIGRNRGAFLNKLYGFKVGEKRYTGLIEELKGRKIGKSSIMIPMENKRQVMELIRKYDVSAKILEVWH